MQFIRFDAAEKEQGKTGSETCLSRRRVCFASRLALFFFGNPAGAAASRSPFLPTFLAKQKSRWPAGASPGMLERRNNRTAPPKK